MTFLQHILIAGMQVHPKTKIYHRHAFPRNEVCIKRDVNPPVLLAVTAPGVKAALRLRNDLCCSVRVYQGPTTQMAVQLSDIGMRTRFRMLFCADLPEKVWVGCMASDDSSGERQKNLTALNKNSKMRKR